MSLFAFFQWPEYSRSPPSSLVRLYNNILPPSALPQKANYYLFKVKFHGFIPPDLYLNHGL